MATSLSIGSCAHVLSTLRAVYITGHTMDPLALRRRASTAVRSNFAKLLLGGVPLFAI